VCGVDSCVDMVCRYGVLHLCMKAMNFDFTILYPLHVVDVTSPLFIFSFVTALSPRWSSRSCGRCSHLYMKSAIVSGM
jgi:hypothetical protein